MKKIALALITGTSLFALSAQAQVAPDVSGKFKVSAKVIKGCNINLPEKVSLIFTGSEKVITKGEKYFDNVQALNLEIQCSKGTSLDITTSAANDGQTEWTYALKHQSSEAAPILPYTIYYITNTTGIKKASNWYNSIYRVAGRQNYTILSAEKQTIQYDVMVPTFNRDIKYYESGDYSSDFPFIVTF